MFNLYNALTFAQNTVEASVLVGGTLLWDNYEALKLCVSKKVSIRFLFPSLDSQWLHEYVSSIGISAGEYIPKIDINSQLAIELGESVEVRFHNLPVASWFTIIDHSVLASKPIGIFNRTHPVLTNSISEVKHFSKIFSSTWNTASLDKYKDKTNKEEKLINSSSQSTHKSQIFLCHSSKDKTRVKEIYHKL